MLSLQDNEFTTLVGYMRENFGINLSQKRNLIEGRLGNHVQDAGFATYQSYLEHVFRDPTGQELSNLVNRLTTNHTFFMRETAHFDFLSGRVLPELEKTLSHNGHEIRTWSAGCSSGEEPYTLAMLMHDHFGNNKAQWDTRILATDISAKALDTARRGRYATTIADTLPDTWPRKYFQRTAIGELEVNERIKSDIVYRSLNLMQEKFPFKKKFHIIFCRNVMIYFEKETKIELVRKFYELTEPGGYLFIGHAESLGREETDYTYIQPAVYRKKA